MVKIADGVCGAIFTEPRMDPVESQLPHRHRRRLSPRLLRREPHARERAQPSSRRFNRLTDKPVRYVVNSHWHDDHIFGEPVFTKEAFPQVEYVAHRNTREDMEKLAFHGLQGGVDGFTRRSPTPSLN